MRLPNLLECALASFVTANVIHNNGGPDPATAKHFLSHLMLFLAAILAIASVSLSLRPEPRTRAWSIDWPL